MLNDIRYGIRSLAKRPLLTTVAALSLAFGIGVNTAIFTIFEHLVFSSLPVPAAEQIVNVASPGPRPGNFSTGDGGDMDTIFSYALFRDLERVQTVFSGIAAQRDFAVNLSYQGQTARSNGLLVSGGYFSTLALTPALGRLLTADDDRVQGEGDVVVLAHSYWATQFGRHPSVVGNTLTVNGTPLTIVGVAPEGFHSTTKMDRPSIFVPLSMAARLRPGWTGISRRNDHWLYLFARLKPGLTREQAQAQFGPTFTGLIRDVEYPELRSSLTDRDRERFQSRQVILRDGTRGQNSEETQEEIGQIMVMLFAVTGLVLLIACANVANLVLARSTDRASEIALRQSLGASRGRLARLVLTEAALLGVLGTLGAIVVAQGTLSGLLTMIPLEDREAFAFGLNSSALLVTGALGLATVFLFGIFPAAQVVRANLVSGLNTQAGRTSGSRSVSRLRTSLATAQIALATALLAQSGLFIVSLFNVVRVDLGIRREGLITFRLSPNLNAYAPERSAAFFERVEELLRNTPGVVSATASTHPLIADSNSISNVTVERYVAEPDEDTTASFALVSTDYFRTIGIPLLAGREFTPADTSMQPNVAIVNEAFARKFKLGSRVIGTRMARGAGNKVLDIEIVGLVRDSIYRDAKERSRPQFFRPYRQGTPGSLSFYARATAGTTPILTAVPRLVAQLDSTLPVERLRTMDDQVWENMAQDRILTTLSSSFAGLATVLAGIGLYAMLAFMVARRVRELGIRMALGATGRDVRRLVFGHVTRITLIGGGIGALVGLALGRVSQSILFGLEVVEPAIIAGAVVVVIAVSALAGAWPARRAASVNPVEALRAE